MSRALVILFAVLVGSIYVRFYVTPAYTMEILTLRVSQLRAKHLFEKQPIVILDRIVSLEDFCKQSFKFLHITLMQDTLLPSELYLAPTTHRFCVVQAQHQGGATDVDVQHPDGVQQVRIPIQPHQCIVVPRGWRFRCSRAVNCARMHDCISYMSSSRSNGKK